MHFSRWLIAKTNEIHQIRETQNSGTSHIVRGFTLQYPYKQYPS